MVSATSEVTLDTSVFDQVIEGGDVACRERLAVQLAAFVADEETGAKERDAVVPTLLKLCADPVEQVRKVLIESLANVDKLHADLMFSIIADDDELALPFLEKSPALDSWRALAILQVGDISRQMIIAARADIERDPVSEIVHNCDVPVCACLLDNEAVTLDADQYRRLYLRFRDEPEIVERLLDRKDLPLEIRILQAKRVANRIHSLMAENGWLPANDADEIVADAEETALLKVLEQAESSELDRLIPFLCNKEMLTPSIILRAACRGDIRIASLALGYLGSMAPAKVRRIMDNGNLGAMRSLAARAGLPKRCGVILKAVSDVARDSAGLKKAPNADQFGQQVVEAVMTRYADVSTEDRLWLADVISRSCDERIRSIARRLRTGLARAA